MREINEHASLSQFPMIDLPSVDLGEATISKTIKHTQIIHLMQQKSDVIETLIAVCRKIRSFTRMLIPSCIHTSWHCE